MVTRQLSPSDLNNKGVLLLESGRREDAARFFRKAIVITKGVMSSRISTQSMISSGKTDGESSKPTEPSSRTLMEIPGSQSPEDNQGARKPTSRETCEQPPRKRKRPSSPTPQVHVEKPTYSIGRPLWIQTPEQRLAPLDSTSLTCTLIYNLGLSFHLHAMGKSEDNQSVILFRKALNLYKMASEILVRAPLSTTVRSPVFVLLLHNMVHAHTAVMEHETAAECMGKLAHVLRLMGASRNLNDKQYEAFYINLLAVPKQGSLAAAA